MPWGTFELLVEGATAGAPVRGAGARAGYILVLLAEYF